MKKTGACKFCGQVQTLNPSCDADEDTLNRIATMQCTCEEAKHYQNIQEISAQIDETWGTNFPETAELAKKAVKYIDKGKMASVSINTGNHMTVKISISSKGEIKVISTESFSNIIQV